MPALDPLSKLVPPEVLYQRRCAKYVYVYPVGLRELMSDISREMLRYHPENMCGFIADYLESLLITRENAKLAMKFVNNVAATGEVVANILTNSNITRSQAEKAARIIQRAVRAYFLKKKGTQTVADQTLEEDIIVEKIINRAKITLEQANMAALVIQIAFRRYRKQLAENVDAGRVDWRLATQRTLGVYRSIEPTSFEMIRAATLIKAAYRGYYTRRLIRHLMSKKGKVSSLSGNTAELSEEARRVYDLTDEQVQNKAAIVIQRAYRNYRRKQPSVSIVVKEEEEIPIEVDVVLLKNEQFGEDFDEAVSLAYAADVPQEFIEIPEVEVTAVVIFEAPGSVMSENEQETTENELETTETEPETTEYERETTENEPDTTEYEPGTNTTEAEDVTELV